MKSAKSFFGSAALAAVLVGFPAGIQAGTYLCDVEKAGPVGATIVNVVLSDTATMPAFTNRTFKAREGREKEILAVALAAIQSGMRVEMVANLGPGVSPILSLFLVP
jgi:hypothetical protein